MRFNFLKYINYLLNYNEVAFYKKKCIIEKIVTFNNENLNL